MFDHQAVRLCNRASGRDDPASQVLDGTFGVYQGGALGQKCFRNFGNEGGGGVQTMRWGLEQSRNLMTIRIANDTGMGRVVKNLKLLGIGDYKPYLSFALGAGENHRFPDGECIFRARQ